MSLISYELPQFSEIGFSYIFDLLKNIADRKSFTELPLYKKAFPFKTPGTTILGSYDGYAIITDFAYGNRRRSR